MEFLLYSKRSEKYDFIKMATVIDDYKLGDFTDTYTRSEMRNYNIHSATTPVRTGQRPHVMRDDFGIQY